MGDWVLDHGLAIAVGPFPLEWRVNCQFCGVEFRWTQPNWYSRNPPLYCKAHKEWKARCPTPQKARYQTDMEAVSAAALIARKTGKPWRPYECGCSGWHLTTQPMRPAER